MPPSSSSLTQTVARPSRTNHWPRTWLAREPSSQVALDRRASLTNLRRVRKGAAPGPSGFTAEIARVVLDAEESIQACADVATLLAQSPIPAAILPAFGLGRAVALGEPSGGTRGLARSLSNSLAPSKQPVHTSMPLAIVWCMLCKLGARIRPSLSFPCACDGISRQSILQELRPSAPVLLSFVRLWLGRPSFFVWHQGTTTRHLSQAEGVEQGDPLSPALFCLALQPAFTDLQRELRDDLGERILSPSSLPLSVCCILSVASSTAPHSSHSPVPQCLPLRAWATPPVWFGLPRSLFHTASCRSVLLSVSRSSWPGTCRLF